jgi:transposase
VGDVAQGDGLRLRHDLLAPAARLAGGRGLRAAPPRAARPARPDERDRLRALLARQRLVPGQKGGELTGPNPTNRGKPGTKRHVIVDAGGVPLALLLSAANVHDSRLLEPLLDAVPPVRQCAGRPRKRPAKLHADKGYDYDRCRRACRRRGIAPRIARRGVENSERLGRYRWVVERTLAWFARFRRLTVRYERRLDILEAFHLLAAALICLRFVERWSCYTGLMN